MSIGQELLNVPFPEMVYELASSIAKAQTNLDMESIEVLRAMGDKEAAPVHLPTIKIDQGKNAEDFVKEDEIVTSMIGAGFQPTFYQFAETIIEVKMSVTATTETEEKGKRTGVTVSWLKQGNNRRSRTGIRVTPVNASYTNKYNYTQEGASLLRTRLVPVPPNNIIQQQLDLRSQAMQMQFEFHAQQLEAELEMKQQQLRQEFDMKQNQQQNTEAK